MKILKKLISYFKSIPLKEEHETEFVFDSGGVPCFKFVNEFNIPYARAMAAADIYVMLEQKTDSKYIKSAFESILELLRKGDNIGAGLISKNSLDRMNNISNIDLMYKLASVLYIDKGENPYFYDTEYNEKKIKRWKQDKDIEGFFLKTPLSDYLPSFDGLPLNMMEYTKGQREELILTLKNHLSMLSAKSNQTEIYSTLKLQIKELEELVMNS